MFALTFSAQAAAQTAAPSESAPEQSEIIVTGSRLQTSAFDSPAPIQVLGEQDIGRNGASNVESLLKSQPAFSGGALGSNSAFFGTNDTGREVGSAQADLRGIGAKYTLVLLDGRRFAGVDPANINSLPLNAIQRIEVLKSGASALYGSDAVSGVVNIITRRSDEAFNLFGESGISGRGDSATYRLAADKGFRVGGLELFAAGDYYHRDGILRRDRERSRNRDYRRFDPNYQLVTKTYTNPAQIFLPDGTGPISLDQARFGRGASSRDASDYAPFDPEIYLRTEDLDDFGDISLINDEKRYSLFGSARLDVSSDITASLNVLYTHQQVDYQRDNWGVDFYGDAALDFGPIAADQYWNPFGVELRDVYYSLPEIGNANYRVMNDTVRVSGGLSGKLGTWSWEVGGAFFEARNNFRLNNFYSNHGLFDALRRPGPAALNPFCNACNTPQQIAGIVTSGSVASRNRLQLADAKLSGKLLDLPGGTVSTAIGIEWRRETLIQRPSQNILDGDVYFSSRKRLSLSRDVKSAYGEIGLPVAGGDFSIPGVRKLIVNVAGRVEDISEVGTTIDPRVSARWVPFSNALSLRASYGTSFRAPSLEALNADQQRSQENLTDPADGQARPYLVVTGGNPGLRSETATYTSGGIVVAPSAIRGLRFSLDYYWLDQKDVVFEPDAQAVLDGLSPGTIVPGTIPTIQATFFNGAGRKLSGFDVELSYNRSIGGVSTSLTGSVSYLDKFKVDTATGQGFIDYAGLVAMTGLDYEGGLPRWRGFGSFSLEYLGWEATYNLSYAGSYRDQLRTFHPRADAYVLHDLQLTRKFPTLGGAFRSANFTLGVEDLTDAKLPVFLAREQPLGFDASIANPRGRYFYSRVSLSF